jgi:DNA-binding NarL/FixJ family response regulator
VVVETQAALVDALAVGWRRCFEVVPVVLDDTATVATVHAAVTHAHPHAVLVGLELRPAFDSLTLADVLAAEGVRVVLMTHEDRGRAVGGPPRPGTAAAVVSTHEHLDAVHRALDEVLLNDTAPGIDRARVLRDGGDDARQAATELLSSLSPRERQVLAHLMQGRPPDEVARRDSVSRATVRVQVREILAKLGVTSQIAAVALGRTAGLQPELGDFSTEASRRRKG